MKKVVFVFILMMLLSGIVSHAQKTKDLAVVAHDSTARFLVDIDSSGTRRTKTVKLPTGGYLYVRSGGTLTDTTVASFDTTSMNSRINSKLNVTDTTPLHNQIVQKLSKGDSNSFYVTKFVVDSGKAAIRDVQVLKISYNDSGVIYYTLYDVDTAKNNLRQYANLRFKYSDSTGGSINTKSGANTWTGLQTFAAVLSSSSSGSPAYGVTATTSAANMTSSGFASLFHAVFTGARPSGATGQNYFFDGVYNGSRVFSVDTNGRVICWSVNMLYGGLGITNGNSVTTGTLLATFNNVLGLVVSNTNSSVSNRAMSVEKNNTDNVFCIMRIVKNSTVVDSIPNDGSIWSAANGTFAGRVIAGSNTDDGNAMQCTGNFKLETAGNKILIATGSNGIQGSGTLASGTVTISNTSVTANSHITLIYTGGTPGNVPALGVSSRVAGTSFTVVSSNASDSGTFTYLIVN